MPTPEFLAPPRFLRRPSAQERREYETVSSLPLKIWVSASSRTSRPVRVYRVQGPVDSKVASTRGEALRLPDKTVHRRSPFTNMSGDAQNEYFADGIAEDIITGLSRLRWLFVIAHNSSFA